MWLLSVVRHPEWETILAGFQAESAWMVSAWSDVVELVNTQNSSVVIARVLLVMREGNSDVCFLEAALDRHYSR